MIEPTADKPTFYESLGRCIYCGTTAEKQGKPLSDEHIVPYSINGGWIFRGASCDRCAHIINSYENVCAHDLFGNFRIRYGYNTRNPKQRPQTIPITTKSADGAKQIIHVARGDFPAPFLYFKFPSAGILVDKPKTLCKFEPLPIMICDGPGIEEYQKAHPEWDGLFSIRACQLPLARLLAKIGHGHANATLKSGTFNPLLTNIILCKTNKVGYLVGGEDEVPAATPGKEHFLSMYFKVVDNATRALIVVNIRLFGQCGTPVFHVVAGEFRLDNLIHRQTFMAYLEDSTLTEIIEPAPSETTKTTNDASRKPGSMPSQILLDP